MSVKSMVVGLLALLCGGSAALMVVLLKGNAPGKNVADTVSVVVATVDIGRGISLTPEMVTLRDWPKDAVPAGACLALADVVGHSSRSAIVRDEPVIKSRLALGAGLNALITPGMRAYTIQTPSVSAGVGGFLQPDDRVDVILTVTSASTADEKRTGGGIAAILLQNVQVLAAGRSLQPEKNDGTMEGRTLNSVTLLVSARQAQELTLAQTKGTLNLALRREGDAVGETSQPLYLSDLPFVREIPNLGQSDEPETAPVIAAEPMPSAVPPPPVNNSYIRTTRGTSQDILVLQSASPPSPPIDPENR